MILGNGCSITSDASIQISKDGCNLAYSKGGANIHTTFVSNQYKNPKKLISQITKTLNYDSKLITAKYILVEKLKRQNFTIDIEEINKIATIEMLLGYEGSKQKIWYNNVFGNEFRRNFSNNDEYNKLINIANTVLYNFIASIISCLGYSPNVGFLHGSTRRGALAFDVSDIFKSELLEFLMDKPENNVVRNCFQYLNKYKVNEIIEIIEEICT